jgi:hypothetical protein
MTNIHSNPSLLRQKFIEYLTLNRKAERMVHTYVSFIYSLARHVRRSPDLLGSEHIRQWLYHLIAEHKQAASTVNLAINAARALYGGLPQRDIKPLQKEKGSNRRLQFQLCAGFVGPRGFVLVLSTARAMEHGFSPFGRANYENVLPAAPTIHHMMDRARIFHSHGARHGASVSG